MKKPKYVYWELSYWRRNTDPEVKIYCCCATKYSKYNLDNFDMNAKTFSIGPEEMWYSTNDIHAEAVSIMKNIVKESEEAKTSDLVCISANLFGEKFEVDEGHYPKKEAYKHYIGKKYWIYPLTK